MHRRGKEYYEALREPGERIRGGRELGLVLGLEQERAQPTQQPDLIMLLIIVVVVVLELGLGLGPEREQQRQ